MADDGLRQLVGLRLRRLGDMDQRVAFSMYEQQVHPLANIEMLHSVAVSANELRHLASLFNLVAERLDRREQSDDLHP